MLRYLALAFFSILVHWHESNGQDLPNHLEYDYRIPEFAIPELVYPQGTQVDAHEGDSLVLVTFYQSTGGPSTWLNRTGWLQEPVHQWHGISLDASGRVISIMLSGNGLSGTLPKELGQLAKLQLLDFYYGGSDGSTVHNEISGEIPPEFGQLASLELLQLSHNDLTGGIPKELGQLANLRRLYLNDNNLTGPIPRELGQLASLELLQLSRNDLTGGIPKELGRLTKMEVLAMQSANLTGQIPQELGQLASLRQLGVAYNKLTGQIPEVLGQLKNLTQLSLGENELSGEIPEALGGLLQLEYLILRDNALTGVIPPELGQLSKLRLLLLNENSLSGSIPLELGQLGSLTNLGLFDNDLSGTLPLQLGQLPDLDMLTLHDNNFSGTIPRELGQLSELSWLNLSGNNLSGSIPQEIAQIPDLRFLNLANNQLSGPVPDLTRLNRLNQSGAVGVQDNRFLFADLLPNATLNPAFGFIYAPQDSINTQLTCEGSQYVFTTPATAQGNAYKWYRDGEEIANVQTNTLRVSATDNPAVYHASITNDALQDLTLYSRKTSTSSIDPCQTRQFTHEGDSLALVELYKSTKGNGWTTKTGWLQAPVSGWHGITLSSEGRVTNVALSENNLEGSLPEEIEDLDSLRVLSLADNVISGLMPNLTSLKQLGSVRVQDNRFLFKDLLPNATFSPASGFTYAPQDSIDTQLTCDGTEFVFTTPATAQGNAYKWYRNGEEIGNEQTNTLRVSASSTGQYHASVTNNALSDLTLYSRKTSTSSSAPCQNSPPTIVNAIADQTIAVGGTYSVDLTTVFSDPDNDVLTFAAISGDEATATATISNNTLTVTGVAVGTATITVSATDTQGSNTKVDDSFTVTVTSTTNSAPTIVNAIADQTIAVGGTYSVDLTTVFSDPDNDVLTFAASSGDEATATATISNSTLTVTGVAVGSATITVSATDTQGSNTKVDDTFTVTVTSNSAPTIASAIADQTIAVGGTYSVDLTAVFSDADNDVLTFAASSGDVATATATISNSTLTVTGVAVGTATITVSATDTQGSNTRVEDSFTVTVTSTARQFAHEGDSLALVNLYNSTEGNTWTRNTGWLQTPVSEWFGITLDADGRVTGVDLEFNNLVGQLPESMGTLAKLDSLLLPSNSLFGPIPPELGQLKELRELWLSFNRLSGAVPAELSQMSKLEELAMTGNQLTGPIPPELGQLANLKYLWLASNRLSGTIPSELRHLEKISVNANNLSGPIPTHLGEWANLIELHLCNNNFTGQIPPVLGQLSELEFLCLRNNQLSGSIPTELNQLSKLKTLWLHRNHLSGPVPDLTSLSQLNSVRINTNQFLFADLLPNAALSRLREFIYAPQDTIETQLTCRASEYVLTTPATAEDNRYQWYRDDQALNGARSDTLRISVMDSPADYHATIKHDLLPDLTLVSRKANTRDASACTRIAHVADSTLLVDFYNRTHGSLLWHDHTGWLEDPVVQWYGITLNASGRVTDIDLPYNNLVGQLPLSQLDQLAHLRYLNVSGNQFSGTIPEELGDLTQLEYLMLSHNKLAGTIPRELADQAPLKVLDISGNQLAGEIPTELNQITTLKTFSVSANQLSGPVPDFTGLDQLDSLHVAQNEFFFMDLLPNASLTRLDDFVYAPQDSIDTFLSRTASGFAFTTAAKAMGNRYQWYRDDQPINGPQSDTLHVSLYADPAQYHATITNDRLPALTLVSRKKGVHDRVTMTEAEFTEDILLHQSYPNPFAEATTVAFELGAPEHVRIVVYDLLGQVVATIADGRFAAGVHRVEFAGDHLASGQYLYRMEAGAYQATRFMSVVR